MMNEADAFRATLSFVPGRFAIARLDPAADVPDWAWSGAFSSVSRTPTELSIVCDDAMVPLGIDAGRGFGAFVVAGPMDLSIVGVLASITAPLATARIALFAVSTFETDYILVREDLLFKAIDVLRGAGHTVLA